MLIDTATKAFDIQEIDNRRFMYEPKTGVLIIGEQYGKVKGLREAMPRIWQRPLSQ